MTAPYKRFGSCGAWGYYLLKQEDQDEEQVGNGIDQQTLSNRTFCDGGNTPNLCHMGLWST